MKTNFVKYLFNIYLYIPILFLSSLIYSQETLSPNDLLNLKYCSAAQLSPNGEWIAYTVQIPRKADDKPGGAYNELYLQMYDGTKSIPFIVGEVNISSIQWKPDGSAISFKMKRGDDSKTQVWCISVNGGEAYQITDSKTDIINFSWHPSSNKLGYVAVEPPTDLELKLKEKGYKFITYEENLKHRNLYLQSIEDDSNPQQLTNDVTVWNFQFSPDGETIAADISQKNLIDHMYMFRKIYLLDIESKKLTQLTHNPGKIGNYTFSPDGTKIAYSAALNQNDHKESQVYVINIDGSNLKNLTPSNYAGHVNWVGWKDKNTILYRSGEGVWPQLSTVILSGENRKTILTSKDSGMIFNVPSYTKDFKKFVMSVSSAKSASELVSWSPGKSFKKLTNLNPVLAERKLGKQSVFKYTARDGQSLEGILIYPTDYDKGKTYPLVVTVHGGPEANYYNGWISRYADPGQVLAGRGYFVFYPNYRASTGYGVDFAMAGFGDPAGVEFDDIADGIDALIATGLADKNRVGLGGGSYGGYAAAWFSSYYTEKVKAVVMSVGISNLISKRGTTDIPYEELYVHSGRTLEEMWQENLKRSPIYYAHQSKTAVLIVGGADDTRVHPSQSMEYYRRLKMNNHPAVRLVQYPGEGHGNRKQTSQRDMLYRLLDWYDWYVKDAKDLNALMPPVDISAHYGIDLY